MVAIDIPYYKENPDNTAVPSALRHAISKTYSEYPNAVNQDGQMLFDKLFEQLYNCKIEYNKDKTVSRVVWDNDYDYIMFY